MQYSFEFGVIILLIGVSLYLSRTEVFLVLPNQKYEKAIWYEIIIVLIGWFFVFYGIFH